MVWVIIDVGLLTNLVWSRWRDIGKFRFSCVFMDQDGIEVHKQAKRVRSVSAILTEQPWSIKDNFMEKEHYFLAEHSR